MSQFTAIVFNSFMQIGSGSFTNEIEFKFHLLETVVYLFSQLVVMLIFTTLASGYWLEVCKLTTNKLCNEIA
jgi:hypothetical protein